MKVTDLKKYKKEFSISLAFIFLILIFTHPVIFKMSTVVYGKVFGTDNRGTIWGFWWLKYAWSNNLPVNFTNMYAYPFGSVMATVNNSSLSLFAYKWLTILTDEIFTYNFILLLGFLLSGIATYFLTYKFTKNKIASAISGLIFTFCPYHFNKAWEHFGLAQTFWVPLYLLALFNLWERPKLKNSIWLAVVFSLMLSFEFNYTYIMSVFTLGFIIFVIFYQWRQKLKLVFRKNPKSNNKDDRHFLNFFKMFTASGLVCIIINLRFIYPIFKTIFFTPKADLNLATANVYVRSFNYLFTHSARPLSYLLPSSAHPVFGNFTKSMFGSMLYGRNSIEQTLYLGWIPLILCFIAFRAWKRKRINKKSNNKDDFIIGLLLFSGVLGFLFSLPPYINLLFFKIYLPSFFMYKILPMYRAYARFGVLVMLAVSILSGFGFKYIFDKIKLSKVKILFTTLIIGLVLFEFTSIPPLRVTDISNPPKVYEWLAKQEGDFVIAEYPMAEEGMGEAQMDYDFIFYQRIHQKPLINGASIGSKGYKIREMIARLDKSSTPGILKYLGTDYIVVHLDKYKTTKAADIKGQVPNFSRQSGLKLIKDFGDVQVYGITAKAIEPNVEH